jgi:hypothetical protein
MVMNPPVALLSDAAYIKGKEQRPAFTPYLHDCEIRPDPDKDVDVKDVRVANWQTAGTLFFQSLTTVLSRKLRQCSSAEKKTRESSPKTLQTPCQTSHGLITA